MQDPTGWLKKQLDASNILVMLERRAVNPVGSAAPAVHRPEQQLSTAVCPYPLLSLPGLSIDAVAPVFAILENITVSNSRLQHSGE